MAAKQMQTGRRTTMYAFNTSEFETQLLNKFEQLKNLSNTRAEEKVQAIVSRMRTLCPVRTRFLLGAIGWAKVLVANSRVGATGQPSQIDVTKGSITGRKGRTSILSRYRFGVIKYRVRYDVYVEYGTSKAMAQPFFRPAIAEVMHMEGTFIFESSRPMQRTSRIANVGKLTNKASERAFRQSQAGSEE